MELISVKDGLPTESKPYLVKFVNYKHVWFEVVHFQAKCKKWKRLDHLVVSWCELPKQTIED